MLVPTRARAQVFGLSSYSLVNWVGCETGDFSEFALATGNGTSIVSNPVHGGLFALQLSQGINGTAEQGFAEIYGIDAGGFAAVYDVDTVYLTFAFQWTSAVGDSPICVSYDANAGNKFALHLSNGVLVAYDSTGTEIGVGSTQLTPNTWYWLAVSVGTGSAAPWSVLINGTPELSGSNSLGALNNAFLNLGGITPCIRQQTYDDIFIAENSFAQISPTQPLQIICAHPLQNGTDTGWTVDVTGLPKWSRLAETVPDGDQSFLYTSTSNDAYTARFQTFESLNVPTPIVGVKALTIASNPTTSPVLMQYRIRSGGTLLTGNFVDPGPGSGYRCFSVPMQYNPNGNINWAAADFDVVEVGMTHN